MQRADGHFVSFGHVGIGIPKPLDGTGTLHERQRDLTFEQGSLLIGSEAGSFIEVELTLQARFLNEHGAAGLFGDERIPKEMIVLPPGVIGGEVDVGREERWREAIHEATLVLANGDGLRGACCVDDFTHAADPAGEFLLSKLGVVVHAERIRAGVHAAGVELQF